MSSHHEELQEIENIKHLWRNGGKVIVGLLLVAALGYLGYNVYWGQWRYDKISCYSTTAFT